MALIHTEYRAGKPTDLDGTLILPIERAVRMQPPGMWGVLIWRRPWAVAIQHPNGREEILQVKDSTRQAQLALLSLGLLGSILIWLIGRKLN